MWIYSTIIHPNREALGLTNDEWCVLDAIYRKQTHPDTNWNGWTQYSVSEIIEDFAPKNPSRKKKYRQLRGWSRRNVFAMLKDLEEMGFLKRKGDLKKTTAKWYKNAYEKVKNASAKIAPEPSAKIAPLVQNLHSTSAKIAPEVVQKLHPTLDNIIDNNLDNFKEKNSEPFFVDPEQNQEEKNTPPIPATPPKKDLLSEARISFEDARKDFQKSKGIDPDVMTWSPSTIRDLEKVIIRLKEKMKLNGRLWSDDLEFNEKYLKPFFLAAAQTEFWFNKIFSISILANRFSDSYDEILIQKNGNASSKTTAKIITPEAAFEATRSLIEEYQRTGSV